MIVTNESNEGKPYNKKNLLLSKLRIKKKFPKAIYKFQSESEVIKNKDI